MPEVRGDRFVGEETVRITIVGALAIAAVIIAVTLLVGHFSKTNSQGPEQSHA
jgi:hypothetical protein